MEGHDYEPSYDGFNGNEEAEEKEIVNDDCHTDDGMEGHEKENDVIDDVITTANVSTLSTTLQEIMGNFLGSRGGGKLSLKEIKTTSKRIADFVLWAHLSTKGSSLSEAIIGAPKKLLKVVVRLITDHPSVLDSYVTHLSTDYERNPSTILNSLDMIDKLYQFIIYGDSLEGQGFLKKLPPMFSERYTFVSKRCKRSVRKDLKYYK